MVEKGEPYLVEEFVTVLVLNNFGYYDIAQLIDLPEICQTAGMYIVRLYEVPYFIKSSVKLLFYI